MLDAIQSGWSALPDVGKVAALVSPLAAYFILRPADRRGYQSMAALFGAAAHLSSAAAAPVDVAERDHANGSTSFSGVADPQGELAKIALADGLLHYLRIGDLPYGFDIDDLDFLLANRARLEVAIKTAVSGTPLEPARAAFARYTFNIVTLMAQFEILKRRMKYPAAIRWFLMGLRWIGVRSKLERELEKSKALAL